MKQVYMTDEAETLRQLADGNEEAFRRIYNQYFNNIYKAATKYLHSTDAAKDVVQEIFLILWTKRAEFRDVRHLKGYLIKMAKNHIYHQLKRSVNGLKIEQEYVASRDHIENPDHRMFTKDYERIVEEAVTLLPPQQQRVFNMVKVEEMNHKTIAQNLNMTCEAVKKNMTRALLFIRKRVEQHLSYSRV